MQRNLGHGITSENYKIVSSIINSTSLKPYINGQYWNFQHKVMQRILGRGITSENYKFVSSIINSTSLKPYINGQDWNLQHKVIPQFTNHPLINRGLVRLTSN